PPVLRAAQDGEHPPVAGVDVAVLLQVPPARIELRRLARKRRHEAVCKRRRPEQQQDDEEREEAELPDPPPPGLGRLCRTSSAEQNQGIVTLELPSHGHYRAHS